MKVAVSRAPGAEREVTPLELFFDLVYVFALGQLSHHLLEHVAAIGSVPTFRRFDVGALVLLDGLLTADDAVALAR